MKFFVILLSCCLLLGACAAPDNKQPAAPATLSATTASALYACLPCGHNCDTLTYTDTGTCKHCNMSLVKKESIRFDNVSPDRLCQLVQQAGNKKILLLDVRTPDEFAGKAEEKFGRLKGALNIPVQELENRLGELSQYRNYDIIVYCSHSHRSPRASYLLTQNGFAKVTNMLGGMSVWKERVKDDACNAGLYVAQ
jgi:rhodanese-related sulfurtransferase/DNA-directed RNA polymerase subunit RPC12/RpoP